MPTLKPKFLSCLAAARPEIPAPTTTMCFCCRTGGTEKDGSTTNSPKLMRQVRFRKRTMRTKCSWSKEKDSVSSERRILPTDNRSVGFFSHSCKTVFLSVRWIISKGPEFCGFASSGKSTSSRGVSLFGSVEKQCILLCHYLP